MRNIRIPKNSKMIRVDIKDYVMSGTHSDLVQCASLYLPDNLKEVEVLMRIIVENQFVTTDPNDNQAPTSHVKVGEFTRPFGGFMAHIVGLLVVLIRAPQIRHLFIAPLDRAARPLQIRHFFIAPLDRAARPLEI